MNTPSDRLRKRVLFLFNHDAGHQAGHIAGIMAELATRKDGPQVIAAVGSNEIEATVRRLVDPATAARISWRSLELSKWETAALSLANRIGPALRLARLRAHVQLFASVDLVVSPERTCLRVRRRLKRSMGDSAPKFVFVPHGAGDRGVTYHPELAQFDWFLLSGQKVVDEMVAHGIARSDQCRLIGYPKFDAIDMTITPRLFDNDLPVVLYNPHFDPHLSSWYDLGPQILAMLARKQGSFNLVFAPHVMLFRKKLHVSLEYRMARMRPDIPAVTLQAPNILVDVDSPRLFDMTYTRGADIYIGDVSSQIYEFLAKPRAAIFVDAAHQGADAYQFWANGPVVRTIQGLEKELDDWRAIADSHRSTQERLFAYTIDRKPDLTASQRGSDAIEALLKRG